MPTTASDVPPQTCPACATAVDTRDLEPLAAIACPKCGEKMRVQRAFDNFQLVETLGAGGMGAVYKARDTRLDRFVALKVLRRELSTDPVEAARLEQEARVTAALNHPNVVQVYSTGTAHDQIYLVMELVDHGSLDDLMAQHGRIAEADVLRAGIQVAKGLQAAQQKGLIHRDVKPANILFANAETAKIGDFGLAVAAGQQAEAQKEIWGTPYYVAPERLNNEPEDFRSDIYSLGATLFHALAGKPPMEGETTSAAELRQLKSHPPDLHTVAPDVSRETARIINKMLALKPENRFTSYAHLITQLEAAARALPGAAGASAPSGTPWLLPVVLVLLLLLGGGGYYYFKTPSATSTPATTATPAPVAPEDTAVLQSRYEAGRQLLLNGKFEPAAATLSRLTNDVRGQPLLNWIRLHAGLATLLDGKISRARDIFQQVEAAGRFSNAKTDSALATFFVETSAKLAQAGPVRANTVGEIKPNGPDALALFLFGVKDWQVGEFDDASTLLQRFVSTTPTGGFAWITDYRPFAQKFLEDYRTYAEWKASPQNPSTVEEIRAALGATQALVKKLQMRGALADELNNQVKRLTADLSQHEQAANLAQEKEREQALATETPGWEAALAEARKRIAAYDFAGALATIERPKLTEPSLKEAQNAERKKASWLVQWKMLLLANLKTGALREPIKYNGVEYEGVVRASEREITLRIPPNNEAAFAWQKFSPAMLLAMSKAFIRPGAADAADRMWLSAVFARATGQEEAARTLAEAAAKARPDYESEIPLLLPPTG